MLHRSRSPVRLVSAIRPGSRAVEDTIQGLRSTGRHAMARKTREDYQAEERAKARADLARAARGGRFTTRPAQYLIDAAQADRDAEEARKAGDDWKPAMPIPMRPLYYVLLVLLLLFLGYIIVRYSL